MRSNYKFIEGNNVHFITSSIVELIPIFTYDKYFKIIIDSMKFCQENKNLKIYYYVILDNHFHAIVSGVKLSDTLASLKGFTAKLIIKQLQIDKKDWILNQLQYFKKKYKKDSVFQVWQEGLHPKIISSYKMFNQKVEYIHFNPVKRGFVIQAEHCKYSSACNKEWDGQTILELDKIEDFGV